VAEEGGLDKGIVSKDTTVLNVALKLPCATRDRGDTARSVNRSHVFGDC